MYYQDSPLSEDGRPQFEIIDRNSARCENCGEEVESTHRHDFRGCKCGRLFVDGGKDYLKRGFQGDGGPTYEETSLSHFEPMTNEEIQQYHEMLLL